MVCLRLFTMSAEHTTTAVVRQHLVKDSRRLSTLRTYSAMCCRPYSTWRHM
ncbi:unnamed protein product [Nippostrongylus brasiliensis]|uniref:Uncharacterized protein n=1 Tax=Nippostrongylus brasiliensis TaxID=27835 RepID=A0A0N4XSQ3_NIPBR|nr:unnamed protein product [Nippostrongylus brasiliensis]